MTRIVLSTVLCLGLGEQLCAAPASQPTSGPASAAVAPIPIEMMAPAAPVGLTVSREDGYKGQWYSPARGRLAGVRLGGGLAFCPTESQPVAIYSAAADKTFFVYAGTSASPQQPTEKEPLRVMVSYFDHKTGTVPRPVVLLDGPADAYGCPALALDATGRLYVFAGFLGTDVPGQVLRSTKPYDISGWDKVTDMEFRNPQVWAVPGQGFMLLHTRVVNEQPRVFFSISPDGLAWSKPVQLTTLGLGDSCISGQSRNKVGIALTYQPEGIASDDRTNLYYLETSDLGKTWQGFPRRAVGVPLTEVRNPALVNDYGTQWRVFLRGLTFSQMGNPTVLYIARHTSKAMASQSSRLWTLSRWASRDWETAVTLYSDSDFDGGDMAMDRLTWYMTVPTIAGPQPNAAGGDLVRWKSQDGGRSWYPLRLTHDCTLNQNWPRHPVEASPGLDFIWADGNPRKPSGSRIYFADRPGNTYVLPATMKDEVSKPELLWKAPPPATKPAPTTSTSNPASELTRPASAPARGN